MNGLVRAVWLLQKYQAGIASLAFWGCNAWVTFHLSRQAGYAPNGQGAQLQLQAIIADYPWGSILVTWFAFAIATAVVYYILRATRYKRTWLIFYALLLIVLYALSVPNGSGDFDYALIVFPIFMLILALLLGVWDFIAAKIMGGQKSIT